MDDRWSRYFATGDITNIDDMSIRAMFFNKDIIKEHGLKTVYDLVYDNEWTYDKFFEYIEIAKKDDGDGMVTLSDTFGVAAQKTFGFVMTMGAGEMLVRNDSEGYPVLGIVPMPKYNAEQDGYYQYTTGYTRK